MRVVDLSDRDLNIRVAKVLDLEQIPERSGGGPEFYYWDDADGSSVSGQFCPTTAWEHGGWVIQQEEIAVGPTDPYLKKTGTKPWFAHCPQTGCSAFADTPLRAAMLVVVMTFYGENV